MNRKLLQISSFDKFLQLELIKKSKPESILKWIIVVASYSFLVYKIITFNRYQNFVDEWAQIPISQFWWLIMVFILLPVNWLLEAKKWQMLVSKLQTIKVGYALKAILSGVSSGFFTPNRVGEFVGRVLFLEDENRKSGVILSVLNSLTQNLVMAMCGIPACYLFFLSQNKNMNDEIIKYFIILTISFILVGLLYLFLRWLSHQSKLNRFLAVIAPFSNCLSDFSAQDLFKILLVTLLRYVVFCVQFYLMLRFFNVGLDFWLAFITIPTTYLFVTFTPSMAFSEAAVRSSYAAIVIGAFSFPEMPIIMAGVSIWIVNFVVPMLAGLVIMAKSKTF